MKYIILLIILLLVLSYNTYNEYYIEEPYIIVSTNGGLNNRLRVLLSYLYKANIENKKLKLIWIKDAACNDDFENLFQDIDNVTIIKSMDNYSDFEKKRTKYVDYDTWDIENSDYVKNNYNKLLKPIPKLQTIINNYKNKLNNNYIACHIRRTDTIGVSYVKHKTDEEYMKYIDQYDNNLKIYIATDNRDTQDTFVKKYGDRFIVKLIEPNNNFRQTSVQDAVVDIFVCVDAKYFLGTFGSSFSDTIYQMRNEENKIIN